MICQQTQLNQTKPNLVYEHENISQDWMNIEFSQKFDQSLIRNHRNKHMQVNISFLSKILGYQTKSTVKKKNTGSLHYEIKNLNSQQDQRQGVLNVFSNQNSSLSHNCCVTSAGS